MKSLRVRDMVANRFLLIVLFTITLFVACINTGEQEFAQVQVREAASAREAKGKRGPKGR